MATPKHTIEIYSAGCATCRETVDLVKKVAGAGADVQVHDLQQRETAARAKELGIRSLPAVVVDGKLASCCAGRGPDEHVLREALRQSL
jgi:predicted DsbA family dithiol-disulfide isomerase